MEPASRSGPPRPRRRRRVLLLLVVYLILLVASHATRLLWPPPSPRGPSILVPTVTAAGAARGQTRIAFSDFGTADPSLPPVLMLHGSPGRGADLYAMARVLGERRRVIVPDLPGFGASSRRIPDYSIRAHARYMSELLRALGTGPVDVVGFSMGGGVALELYDVAPESVRSVALLSAIGVQDFELLGDYRLNHLVHALQLGVIWLIEEGIPHFGLLDDTALSLPYARNFFDSDQRPLRGILERLEPPLLVLHGRRDFLVAPAAAVEHHRIVPQSELLMLDESHFMVFSHPRRTAEQVEAFLERVDAHVAPRRSEADPQRLAAAVRPFDPRSLPPATGFALLLLMLLIALATLVSEDLTCIGAGLMVAQGRIEFLPAVIACCAGIFVGDMLLYFAGRLVGRPALSRAPLRWLVDEEQVEAVSRWLDRRGAIVIGLSRFVPGTRLPTYFAAGALHTRFWSFALYFLLAVALWTPILVWLSLRLGARAFETFERFERNSLWALLALALAILALVKLVLPLSTRRGRRMLAARWRRLRNWEFWPPWVFYPPVLLRVLGLGLRYRSPLLFTAANPAMPAGGFIGERKSAILQGLSGAEGLVARTRLISGASDESQRVASARAFMSAEGLDFPLVLKPDTGQRGSGVAVVRSQRQLAAYFARSRFDVLVQEYIPGHEFGVFYYRYPDEPRGRLFSITEKRLPEVIGDGHRTIERLILDDRRAVCMAAHYLSQQAHQLGRVPAPGERVRLVELGTHCRGAIFLDGSRLASEALARVIDEVSRGYEGFYFGRYDIRTPSAEDLQAGRNLKIIELNGVTSEATHIYDPRNRLWNAYRTLFEQWRIAFEIGRRNRMRGVQPTRLRELLRLVRDYRRSARSHEISASALQADAMTD